MSEGEFWTLVLSAINAFIVLVLAAITGWYAWSAKRQAKAAEKQAESARKQAEFAERTLTFFQTQTEEQTRIAIAMLVGSVAELMGAANYWHGRLIQYGSVTKIENVRLLPSEWAVSLERAKEIPPSLYQELQNLQRLSRDISRSIEQFSATDLTYRSTAQTREIQQRLAQLIRDCKTVFNKLGPLLPRGLIDGYLAG